MGSGRKRAKRSEANEPCPDGVLFSSGYDLTDSLIGHVAVLVTGERKRTMTQFASVGVIVLILAGLWFKIFPTEVAVVLVLVSAGLLALADKWVSITRRALGRLGWATAGRPTEELGCKAEAYEDKVVMALPDGATTYPLSDLTAVDADDTCCALAFKGGGTAVFVRQSMSMSRYKELVTLMRSKLSR